MTKTTYTRILCGAAVLSLAACSQDVPAGDPGGMGADDLNPPAEVGSAPAAEILEQVNTSELSDSTPGGVPAAGGPAPDTTQP